MGAALARHDELVRGAIEAHEGYVFATGGDGFAAAFARPHDAVAAAQAAQAALGVEAWPVGVVLRVRMGVHTGVVDERDGNYFGQAVNLAARVMAAGHGGQVLVSAATAGLIGSSGLTDLGEHTFVGLDAPERVYQVGASTFALPSLSLDGDADAVALFAERAARAQPGFSLDDPVTRESAVAVCRRLDGIPLAIELAAARARVVSVDQIAAHLDERFRLLTRGGRTAVPRQQTLEGAIGWSYDLLTAPERSLWSSSWSTSPWSRLIPPAIRYRLLETLRQYAWERLIAGGRLGEVRDAHAGSFAALAAEQAWGTSEGVRPVAALDRLDADYDNLRAALAWLIEQHRADAAARMVRRLAALFNIRHPREGLGWFQAVVAISGELPVKVRARVLADTAWAALYAGDLEGHGPLRRRRHGGRR
jgi:hypothetical protein